ncbi:MAG: Mut7-C ubiquitin/RNAse domain-containing protein [Prolixibacteraceae bacterium]|nr:Mut7-C ubiquitin/RNAse domain-containing protein [Prolixibacteraceae bacterium]MBN2775254.1 Mut7-C ubiquitin/RNAse domain-containing protein [Prolixibacteraceae bacterium]
MDSTNSNIVTFRFYEELNDHLKPQQRKKEIFHIYHFGQTVKDAIEKLGVPHCEVDLIIANGGSVGFDYRLHEGDYISFYPVFESFDISAVIRLRPEPLRIIKFVLDTHLGKLAKYLRLLGFDTLYSNAFKDDEIAELSINQKRIILTRDRGLLMQKKVTHGYFLRNTDPMKQLREVIARFQLFNLIKSFTRCSLCNGEINSVEKEMVMYRLPESTANYYTEFFICSLCNQVYWQGSHYYKLLNRIKDLY